MWSLLLAAIVCSSCVRGVFQPVNVGREYGDNVPVMVTHLSHEGQWALTKRPWHWPGQQVVCFNYMCRKLIGKRRAMKAISFDDFKKRIAKNAKKGVYKTPAALPPPKGKMKQDSIVKPVVRRDTVIAQHVPEVKEAAVDPVLKADSLITLGDFLFETNSAKLKAEHYQALDDLGKFLSDHPTLELSISGHTDNTGTERHNVSLSTRRAQTVADYLVDLGVSDDKIKFEGFGSSRPIATNNTPEGRTKNRRVEVLIKKPG